jgi:hypothetical protein
MIKRFFFMKNWIFLSYSLHKIVYDTSSCTPHSAGVAAQLKAKRSGGSRSAVERRARNICQRNGAGGWLAEARYYVIFRRIWVRRSPRGGGASPAPARLFRELLPPVRSKFRIQI